jgi:NTE family protein
MANEGTYKIQERKKGTAIESKKQRALIFQGGGALGAYEAGAYRVLYDWISRHIEKKNENLFDVIAGTSIGAINGAIILSHFLKKKNADINKSLNANEYWKGSADTLEKFWQEIQTKSFFTDWIDLNFWPWDILHTTVGAMKKDWNSILDRAEESIPYIQYNFFIKEWFDLLHFATEAWDIPAKAEAARRYWTTRTLGAPNVAAAIPRWDLKYWDIQYGFKLRGEQGQLPFSWFSPFHSLKESCENYINFPIKTDYDKDEPRFLLVTVDVQSGDTVSFDSYDVKTEYDEYDQWKDNNNKSKEEHDHIIKYPNGIEWDHLRTTFSLPELYRYPTLQDEQSGKKRTFWDGGILSNTPLRELIDRHKDYWINKKIGKKRLWDGMMEKENEEKKNKIPPFDVYIIDVWPSKLLDDPVPSDNDFAASRKIDLILLDKTEYEESVTKMITQYMHIIEELLTSLNDPDKSNKIKDVLDKPIIDTTLNTKDIKTYRDLLKGNVDINRVMRIERKDDWYTIGNAIADFSAHTMTQLLELGKQDALDNLIHNLCHTIDNLDKTDKTTKNRLSKHLEKAKEFLQNKENYYYQEVMNHLYDFIDEVNRMESDGNLTPNNANLLRP